MKAMVLDRFGGPEVLYLADIERPRASPGNVVVQVAFAGVNPADWKAREGWLASYFQYQFPFVLGFDAAGIIAAPTPSMLAAQRSVWSGCRITWACVRQQRCRRRG